MSVDDPLVRLLTLDPLSRLLMLGLALDPARPGPVPAPGDWDGLRGVSLRPPAPLRIGSTPVPREPRDPA